MARRSLFVAIAATVAAVLPAAANAATPGFAAVLASVPGIAIPVLAGTALWMLAAMVVAVRQALDYETTGRAMVVCIVGWALAMAFALGLGMLFGPRVS